MQEAQKKISEIGPQTCRAVAWLNTGHEGYGPRRMALTLSAAVRDLGWRTPFLMLTDGPFAEFCRVAGMEVHALDLDGVQPLTGGLAKKAGRFLGMMRTQRQAAKQISETLRDLNVDALHFIWPTFVGLGGGAARHAGIPAFWEMPNDVSSRYPLGINRAVYQWQCRRYGITPLAISRHTARTLGDRFVKPVVSYLSCDPELFDPARIAPIARQELGIPDDAVVFTICARLVKDKGQAQFLEAMLSADDSPDTPHLHLLLLGGPTDGPFVDRLRCIAEQHYGSDRLHLIGPVPDPQRYYAATDIAVNSRIVAEPFGLSVVEAMMMSRPVVVHALGGPAETVLDGVTGWHIHEPTPAGFAEGIRRALADRPQWGEMGRHARRRALEEFSSPVHARRYAAIVEERLRDRERLTRR